MQKTWPWKSNPNFFKFINPEEALLWKEQWNMYFSKAKNSSVL